MNRGVCATLYVYTRLYIGGPGLCDNTSRTNDESSDNVGNYLPQAT